MNPINQIIILFLLLLGLIGGCVYTHINDFPVQVDVPKETEQKVVLPEVKDQDEPVVEKEVSIIKEKVAPLVAETEVKTQEEPLEEDVTQELKKEDPVAKVETILPTEKIIEKVPDVQKTTTKIQTPIPLKEKEELIVTNNEPLSIQSQIDAITKKQKIIFKRSKYKITQKSYNTIKKIADLLLKNKNVKIEIGGHTDALGKDDVNAWVSLTRAKSVRKELTNLGVEKARMKVKGYGESQPLVKNKKGYSAVNRRVEFKVIEE